jgi:hypothetical protein
MTSANKRVYMFAEGRYEQKELLGNKGKRLQQQRSPQPTLRFDPNHLFAPPAGANLCEMTRIGLPVPPGFVITTTTCLDFFKAGKVLPPGFQPEYKEALKQVQYGRRMPTPCPSPPILRSPALLILHLLAQRNAIPARHHHFFASQCS